MKHNDIESLIRHELRSIATAVNASDRDYPQPPVRRAKGPAGRRLGAGLLASAVGAAAIALLVLRETDKGPNVEITTQPSTADTSTFTVPTVDASTAVVEARPGWRLMARSPLSGRRGHTAVWTGAEMIVWGGRASGGPDKNGAAYDPRVDRWRSLPAAPLDARHGHVAVWSGSEMIVVGGRNQRSGAVFSDGAAYDPKRDQWRRLPSAPFEARLGDQSTAVWTGDEMILWGGDVGAAGAAYSPSTDRWRILPSSGLTARTGHTAVWTGSEMIVWGGIPSAGTRLSQGDPEMMSDGARYSAQHDEWRPIARSPLTRAFHAASWTGQEMVVVGGTSKGGAGGQAFAAAYDIEAGRWRTVPSAPLSPRSFLTAVSTHSAVVVWGGEAGSPPHGLDDGASYSPIANSWTTLPMSMLSARGEHTSVWTGTSVLIWGGEDEGSGTPRDDGALFTPVG